MTYSYTTHGTCSRRIDFDIDDDNTVHNVHFTGGCNGNLAGISSIVEGMDAEEIIDRFDGIRCGFKQTSCPDQFAEALREALEKKNSKQNKKTHGSASDIRCAPAVIWKGNNYFGG